MLLRQHQDSVRALPEPTLGVPLRPPTFWARTCGGSLACAHHLSGSCRHPLAYEQWGHLRGMYRFLPDGKPVWPVVGREDWCGFWRPAPEPEAETQGELSL